MWFFPFVKIPFSGNVRQGCAIMNQTLVNRLLCCPQFITRDMSDLYNIKLWCWVLGDKPDRVFSVSIEHSADIEYLKKTIQKQKSSFEDITADALHLYKVGWVVHITAGMHILTPGSLNSLWINSSVKVVHKVSILKSARYWTHGEWYCITGRRILRSRFWVLYYCVQLVVSAKHLYIRGHWVKHIFTATISASLSLTSNISDHGKSHHCIRYLLKFCWSPCHLVSSTGECPPTCESTHLPHLSF